MREQKEPMTDNAVKDIGSKDIFTSFHVNESSKDFFCNRNEWIEDSIPRRRQ